MTTAAKKTTTAKTTSDNGAEHGFDASMSFAPEALKDNYEKFAESVSAFAEFNKGALDALMAAAGAYSEGFEKITSEHTAYLKEAYERAVATAKSASSAKSPQEAFDIQSDFARDAMERQLGQAGKVSELMIDTTKKTMAPLTERYSELVEKIQAYRP